MAVLRMRKRHRLRQKEIHDLSARISSALGTETFGEGNTVDMAETPDFHVLFVDGASLGLVSDGEPFLTVRGLLRYGATKRFVTVDMGAVPFVANGADVMGPGVVDADRGVAEGDFVWVRDERNLQPLAVGRALVSANDMLARPKGKVVSSVHFVGDRLWAIDEEAQE
ncbi:MAG: RNA-binding protein [Methanobacteriota archaeon]|nr:MAG: RNA-binding protein [Euryarchaeota archaeon]